MSTNRSTVIPHQRVFATSVPVKLGFVYRAPPKKRLEQYVCLEILFDTIEWGWFSMIFHIFLSHFLAFTLLNTFNTYAFGGALFIMHLCPHSGCFVHFQACVLESNLRSCVQQLTGFFLARLLLKWWL